MITLWNQTPMPSEAAQCRRARRLRLCCAAAAGLAGLAVSVLVFSPALALDTKQSGTIDPVGAIKKAVESPIHFTGVRYNSGNRRDPFLNPVGLSKGSKPVDEELAQGLAPPGIAGTYIAQATLQGISIQDSGRVAVVRGADARAYFLREGDRLFDGYLKAIESDSITLVRETKMKSGKTRTQDVTKRLRTQ